MSLNLDKPLSPRHFEVSADIGAPRQQALPPLTHAELADRVLQRLEQAEHKISVIEGHLAALAEVIYGKKH